MWHAITGAWRRGVCARALCRILATTAPNQLIKITDQDFVWRKHKNVPSKADRGPYGGSAKETRLEGGCLLAKHGEK